MRHKSHPLLSLLLVLAFCAQASSWLAPCASCHAAGMDACACHRPAVSSCADGSTHPAQLTRACCCEIATSAEPDRDNAVPFVVENPVANTLNFPGCQELLTLPSLRPTDPVQPSLPKRSTGPTPPLFMLHSTYLI